MVIMNELLAKLAAPFAPNHITWKPGASKDNKCLALAYGDLRVYQERLDAVCGMDWSVRYAPWGDNRIICELTINGVTRSSTGEMDGQDEKNGMGGTVAEAQAMKRAASQFGLGRFLYELPSVWVEFDPAKKRITEAGQRELEQRYKAWYSKLVPTSGQVTVTSSTAVDEVANPFTHGEEMSPHQRLWAKGMSCFNSDWDMARPWLLKKWTTKVTPAKVRTSAGDLSDEEKAQLADYLGENCAELRKIWPRQKSLMLQSAN